MAMGCKENCAETAVVPLDAESIIKIAHHLFEAGVLGDGIEVPPSFHLALLDSLREFVPDHNVQRNLADLGLEQRKILSRL